MRLALHTARTLPEIIHQLERPIIFAERLFDHGLFHEVMLLLHQRFALLPDDQKAAVHEAIREGPPALERETAGDRESRVESWRRHLLGKLPAQHHTAEEAAWRDELGVTSNETDESLFLYYSTSGWVAEPVEEPDLGTKLSEGLGELLSYLREEPRRWRGLPQLVQDDPQAMLTLPPILEERDFPNLSYYLEAYGELVKSGVAFSWTPLIDLCERIVSARQGPVEYQFSALSRLLRNGLAVPSQKQGIPDDLRTRALRICAQVLSETATPLTEGIPRDRESTMHQLNSAAGEAADALPDGPTIAQIEDPEGNLVGLVPDVAEGLKPSPRRSAFGGEGAPDHRDGGSLILR